MKTIKATAEQKKNYTGVYPLHIWVQMDDGLICALEDLRCWAKPDPQWEIVAPKGYVFSGYRTHSLLGETQKDAKERASYHPLEKCDGADGFCDCAEYWKSENKA